MTSLVIYLAISLLAYLLGAIPFGFLIGRFYGIDIREHGSGNVGATNVTRSVGKKAGKLCFFLDMLKGLLPVLVVTLLIKNKVFEDPHAVALLLAAFCPIAGHMWSVFLKFKGGKGISTAGGGVLILAPWSFLTASISWVVLFWVTRYVSLASIIAAAIMGISVAAYSALGWCPQPRAVQIYLALLALLTIFKHRSNIKRLFAGTESRFEKKAKTPETPPDKESA
jgi:acyl phosphate:glycerol-3-phosphate acyltransferase